ncbi:30S ribosomal protein S4 [bacterium]|jgi:small subunit ribosomal protein S4|nr:30S ribosomal protein S4 [bacterium]MDP6756172.1 30S ribosomal protein S4 [Patescibacteria group bacterium]|tara:strand:- start:51122 stop:51745 length:624 start_codon:yes stop_codon:yes gene_type:complete
MARDLTPKYKRSRREGVDLHPDLDKAGTAKSPLTRKGYQPGVHGPRAMRIKVTNYGVQLREKQKAKRMYGVLEKQFRNYYKKAINSEGDTGEAMLTMLERRLDNIVYRLGFAKTRPAARQMVSHGHILVNGKKSTTPSTQVPVGATVSIKESIAKSPTLIEKLKELDRSTASWLSKKDTQAKVVAEPDVDEPKALIDVRRIVEFYSR